MSLSLGLSTISIKIAHLGRYVVEKVGLDPDSREVEIQLKLPEERAKHVEAAARIGALGRTVVLARQFLLVNGRGRRPQRLRGAGGSTAR